MKRLVLFVEGEGESAAAPVLIKRFLTELNAWDAVFLDLEPFRVGQVNALMRRDFYKWKRWLRASQKRSDLGAVLLLLDGDVVPVGQSVLCPASTGQLLSAAARETGAASTFSAATVFALREFESWFIAGFDSLAGRSMPDGRLIRNTIAVPSGDLEQSPRDAKGWMRTAIDGGYKPTRDQAILSEMIDLQMIRDKQLRSFQRLETAVESLVTAMRSGNHLVSPQLNR